MPTRIFFHKTRSVTFVPLWCPNFMQNLRKTNKQPLWYMLRQNNQTRDGPHQTKKGDLKRSPTLKPVQNHMHHRSVHVYSLSFISRKAIKEALLLKSNWAKIFIIDYKMCFSLFQTHQGFLLKLGLCHFCVLKVP